MRPYLEFVIHIKKRAGQLRCYMQPGVYSSSYFQLYQGEIEPLKALDKVFPHAKMIKPFVDVEIAFNDSESQSFWLIVKSIQKALFF